MPNIKYRDFLMGTLREIDTELTERPHLVNQNSKAILGVAFAVMYLADRLEEGWVRSLRDKPNQETSFGPGSDD